MSSVQVEPISTDSKEIAMQEASLDIWDKKYRLKTKHGDVIDQTIDDTYKRVARAKARLAARYASLVAAAADPGASGSDGSLVFARKGGGAA